jgi:hypothetical protein
MSWVFISLGRFNRSTAQVLHDLQVIQSRTGELRRAGAGALGRTILKRLEFGCCKLGRSGPVIMCKPRSMPRCVTKKLKERKERKKRKK